jgi:hypothetical protein
MRCAPGGARALPWKRWGRAALLYNFMLACDANRKRLQDEYHDGLAAWAELVEDARPRYESWDRKRSWMIVSESAHAVRLPTRTFVDGWIDHTLRSAKLAGIADDLSLPKTPSAGVTATTESEHDCD